MGEVDMDNIKTGKFIAECRKKINLTQMQLAEKLNITDRAISKWETGKCLPDVSIMPELCKELNITLNELLSGERENNNSEQLLLQELNDNIKKQKKIGQGISLLGASMAFNITTSIFGADNQMVIVFSGITLAFTIARMITLLRK